MSHVTSTILSTDSDGRARFKTEPIALDQGTPQSQLSPLKPSGGLQWRQSPAGFKSEYHVTTTPQWVFILQGRMAISLRDGSTRTFGPGEHFFSNDTLPPGVAFDPQVHGHASAQVGDQPLVTVFVRA